MCEVEFFWEVFLGKVRRLVLRGSLSTDSCYQIGVLEVFLFQIINVRDLVGYFR